MTVSEPGVVNLEDKLSRLNELWSPRVVAEINDYQIKLAKLEGEFVWHRHVETDELFLCLSGSLTILFRDREVVLSEGELCVVPKGVEHKPVAANECHVLLMEPRGVVNTGNPASEDSAAAAGLTAAGDQWL